MKKSLATNDEKEYVLANVGAADEPTLGKVLTTCKWLLLELELLKNCPTN